jgi:hypothetical protein
MRRGEKTWETKLKLEDLREITERFIELILEETDDQQASFL